MNEGSGVLRGFHWQFWSQVEQVTLAVTRRALRRAGYEVVVYHNLSTGSRRLAQGFQLVEGDIGDETRLRPVLKRVDAVMHFADHAYVGESVENPRKYFKVTGRTVRRSIQPRRPGDPPTLVADPVKAQSMLAWVAKRGLSEIVSSAWRWMETGTHLNAA